MAFDLSEYRTVAERIADFKAKHPDGCLRPANLDDPYRLEVIGGQTFVVYMAAAYRTPDDPCPGVGVAWEPFPGKTNYTRDSELQNAETSAWGRALIAVLATESKNIASAEDVRNREADRNEPLEDPAVPGLRSSIEGAIGKLDDEAKAALKAWFEANDLPPVRKMNQAQCDRVLDHLLNGELEEQALIRAAAEAPNQ